MNSIPDASSAAAPCVQVSARTWAKETHGFFDFESRSVSSNVLTVQGATIFRAGSEVVADSDAVACRDQLVEVEPRPCAGSMTYWVKPAGSSNKLWQVVRDITPEGFKLAEHSVIRLGRWRFRVRQLVTAEQDGVQPDLGTITSRMVPCLHVDDENPPEAQRFCRICLTEAEEGDPLLAPCECKGTIEHVHLSCLRHWANTRLSGSNHLGSHFHRSLACELCKATYPTHVMDEDKPEPLLELPRTKPPFVVLEKMGGDAGARGNGLHVLSLADKPITIGRSADCDVRIADVSASRVHATIHFQDGEFLLRDNKSKFGTCVAVKGCVQIEESRPVSVQVGRTVLSLSLNPARTSISASDVSPSEQAD